MPTKLSFKESVNPTESQTELRISTEFLQITESTTTLMIENKNYKNVINIKFKTSSPQNIALSCVTAK